MHEQPRHPTPATDERDRGTSGRRVSRPAWLWWIVGIAAVVLFLMLHVVGVLGPGGH